MLLVDLKLFPSMNGQKRIKSICIKKDTEIGVFKQMLKKLIDLPESAEIKI